MEIKSGQRWRIPPSFSNEVIVETIQSLNSGSDRIVSIKLIRGRFGKAQTRDDLETSEGLTNISRYEGKKIKKGIWEYLSGQEAPEEI